MRDLSNISKFDKTFLRPAFLALTRNDFAFPYITFTDNRTGEECTVSYSKQRGFNIGNRRFLNMGHCLFYVGAHADLNEDFYYGVGCFQKDHIVLSEGRQKFYKQQYDFQKIADKIEYISYD